jgi:peptidoglycan/LPS O-acetylase OafA/YrhL
MAMSVTPATPSRETGQTRAPAVRRHELDWLRTAAVFGLIPFHTAVIFTTGSYDYVRNPQTSLAMNVLTTFISIWGIPLLFFVAGGSARYALARRGVKRYINERVTRLAIPFIFGMLLIVPLQVYIGRVAAPEPAPPFPTFYGQFLLSLALIFTGQIPRGPDWIGHLWFIPPLMLFAALAIPYAWLLRTRRGQAFVEWLATAARGYGALALLGLPLALAQWLALEGVALMATTSTQFAANAFGTVSFLLFFLYGYLLYLDERFLASVRRATWVMLALGAVTWVALAFAMPNLPHLGVAVSGPWWRVALALLRGYCGHFWVIGILGLAIRYLSFSHPIERYLAQAAYPVYIIHMPILSLIALWAVTLGIGILPKFFLITLASLAVALLIYEWLIRRVGLMRLLFGLRNAPQRAPPKAQSA